MTSQHPLHHVTTRPWEALVVFLVIFFLMCTALAIVDFVPEEPGTIATKTPTVTVNTVTTIAEVTKTAPVQNINLIAGPTPAVMQAATGLKPTRVVIAKVGVDTPVSNPTSQSLSALDDALLSGAVRYPGTAFLNEEGSVVIFGHQSYLPVVHNKAFKAFNDVQKLVAGDIISVYAGNVEYRYAVRTVTLTTTDAGSIALDTKGQTLTLVTCNSLGSKEERNIVKADLIGTFTN